MKPASTTAPAPRPPEAPQLRREHRQEALMQFLAAPEGAPFSPPAYPHETDFSVITVGTGNPRPSLQRSGPCTMLQHRGRYYVVDMGNGAQNALLRGDKGMFRFRDIAAFCFTHFHQDHTNDYFDIATNRWVAGGKELTLVGPPGVATLHEFLITFFRDDLSYRMLLAIPWGASETGMFGGVTINEITGSQKFRLDDLEVTTAKLTHTMYNLGYRFEADGKAVVVSGDTSLDEHLVQLAAGADVLVSDCTGRWRDAPEQTMPALDAMAKYQPSGEYGGDFRVAPHASMEEVGAMAARAGVKHLVMTHLPDLPMDEEAMRATVRAAGFGGRVTVASDGLEIAV
jgi:ribonuclease BN (tRNA processing enzyme)